MERVGGYMKTARSAALFGGRAGRNAVVCAEVLSSHDRTERGQVGKQCVDTHHSM